MSPAEHLGANGETLAIVYEGQEVELVAADGKDVYIKGTQYGFDVEGDNHYGEYGPEQKKAYLQLQFGQILRPIALTDSSLIK